MENKEKLIRRTNEFALNVSRSDGDTITIWERRSNQTKTCLISRTATWIDQATAGSFLLVNLTKETWCCLVLLFPRKDAVFCQRDCSSFAPARPRLPESRHGYLLFPEFSSSHYGSGIELYRAERNCVCVDDAIALSFSRHGMRRSCGGGSCYRLAMDDDGNKPANNNNSGSLSRSVVPREPEKE